MAPRPDLITDLGWEFINSLPPALRDDPTNRAILHCSAKEAERLQETIDFVRAQMNPVTAGDTGLQLWERLLRLPIGLGTEAERRSRVVGRYRALEGDPSGANWIQRVSDRLAGAPWSYLEHNPGDPLSPAPQVVRILIPFLPGTGAWDRITQIIADETPSELGLEFVTTEGFILDEDQLDIDTLGL